VNRAPGSAPISGQLANMTAVTGVREGDILAGKYRIEKILGQGAVGVVVAARHLQLDERVAIKFLLPEALSNPEAVARFAREARVSVKIKSEHVARVGDIGTLENGAPFMVMEYLEGEDLEAWMEQRGPLSVEQTIEFVLQALEAIAEAHALGIIHRDLKPANLFCIRRADGLLAIKVLDFGISKLGGVGGTGADMSMTKTQDVMGSPLYMSPEQMRSARDVDATTDIWAVGVILFELLTGKAPFVGDNMPELVLKIATSPPEPMRSLLPTLPDRLEEVVLKCLEKDRTKRYRNVAELAAALVEFGPKRGRMSAERIARTIDASGLSGRELTSPPSSGGDPAKFGHAALDVSGESSPKRAIGRRVVVGLAFALVAGIAVVFAHFFARSPIPQAVAVPELEASATTPPSSAPRSSPAPAERPVVEPSKQVLQPPVRTVPITPSTGASPTRSTRAKSAPAASSVVLPGTAPSAPPTAIPPRTGSAYDDRK